MPPSNAAVVDRAGRVARGEHRAVEARRRARLHPERPVRAVLPRPAEGLLRGRRPRRRIPEQDRPGPHPARRGGHDRHRDRRRDQRHPGRQPGHPDRVRRDDLRPVPEHRLRQGVVGHQEGGRPEGQEDRHARQVRVGLGDAPGAARLGRADDRRRRDRRVSRLHPGDRGRAGRRRRRDRVRQQRAGPARATRARRRSSCTSTTPRRCPVRV